ncbi:MAG TPA: NAD(P)H-binding protein [Saprospiraceae bacterium]|nr:NAD(P)H-binding protein [Saprospiraceae bacterium]
MRAIVMGASGLTGSFLCKQLCDDPNFHSVKLLVRKSIGMVHPKITECMVDFNNVESIRSHMEGEVLFCATGTTIKKAGSKEKFIQVDYELPLRCAKIAAEQGVKKLVIVSSIGADKNSGNFYLNTKGRLESELEKLPFNSIQIMQPSLLMGPRKEDRLGEKIAMWIMPLMSKIFFGPMTNYKPVHVRDLASAMIRAAGQSTEGIKRWKWREIIFAN